MKLKFISNLDYQQNAINSIVNIFQGIATNCNQVINQLNLYNINNPISNANQSINSEWYKNIGIKNIKNIQEKNGLEQIQYFSNSTKTFDVEMETGTGKTYIYLRTILELHTKYHFSKFIILVPGNAVKEGVLKTISITKEHFSVLYNNIPYNWSNYDSKNFGILNDFAENNNLEIMIMNIQQINKYNEENNKQSNNIYKETDQLNGRKPIEMIQNINPIIFIDEPQTTASGLKSIKSIEKLNPLFIVRYSATFKKRNDEILMYQLNAIDAYKQNLVKHISGYGIEENNNFNKQIK
ncbi:MAG: DEAD/DEAH box helicase family protein, partial [Ureaplasma sp.]|nr:DEAD/DEAH box helicase family protein [Ureaplasma sp.]